jgi:hypothetical protein
MRWLAQDLILSTPDGRGVVLGEARPGGKTKQRRRQSEPHLEIAENIFGEETVMALLDKWIIPAIVDEFIRDKMNSVVKDTR